MLPVQSSSPSIKLKKQRDRALPYTAPIEIHGGRDRGCASGDDYFFQGHRYIYDERRDVLVRDDVGA